MTEPLFLLDDLADPLPITGAHVVLAGDEGRHAAVSPPDPTGRDDHDRQWPRAAGYAVR